MGYSMFPAWHERARPLTSVVAALLLMFLTVGVAGVAQADPGHGQGRGQATTSGSSTKSATQQTSTSQKSDHQKSTQKSTDTKTSTHKAAPKSTTSTKTTTKASSHSTSGTAGTSGDPKSPQPVSNADSNSGGANGQCPGGAYCSTRDGSPSMNGNGGGKATGKPCAGCVGKADNKNPKGQAPDGSDHNAGYECDRNHGIGRTNPAHTGCTPTPETPPGECVPTDEHPCTPPPPCVPTDDEPCTPPGECVPTDDEPCTPPGECVPTDDEPCTPPAECVPTTDKPCVTPPGTNRPPTVLGTEATRSPAVLGTAATRAPVAAVAPSAAALPATGAGQSDQLLALLGGGLVLTGATMLVARRKAQR